MCTSKILIYMGESLLLIKKMSDVKTDKLDLIPKQLDNLFSCYLDMTMFTHTWITVAYCTGCLNAPMLYLASLFTDHSPNLLPMFSHTVSLLAVLLTLPWLVYTLVFIIIVTCFPSVNCMNDSVYGLPSKVLKTWRCLTCCPPLPWSTHVGSSARGPYYHIRFRYKLLMLRHVN